MMPSVISNCECAEVPYHHTFAHPDTEVVLGNVSNSTQPYA